MNETTRKGRIFGIQRFSLHDGDGIRTAVFFKGCNLRCAWCHNPETFDKNPTLLRYPEKCIGCGHCDDCPTGARTISGREVSVEDIMREVRQDAAYYKNSDGGVTLSGGEVKRVEIATLMARKVDLAIFDEPEAGIDLWSFQNLITVFEKMYEKEDCSILIISHQERIIRLADEIVVIANGQIAHRGSTDEVFPLILADTLGGCPVLERKEGAQ